MKPSAAGTPATVWLACYYGGLPSEGLRDYRCTLIARELVRRGYRVIWWVADFNHVSKTHRGPGSTVSGIDGLEIRLVPAPAYRANVSLQRIRSEWRYGKQLEAMTAQEPSPAAILLMEPARFYGDAVLRMARRHGARLVLDVIDLWPELFETVGPAWARPFTRLLLQPLHWQRNRLVRRSDAVIGVTADYAEEVARKAGFKGPTFAAYWGWHRSVESSPPPQVAAAADRGGRRLTLAVYAGMLGSAYDIETLLQAAQQLRGRDDVRWIVAGSGPLQAEVEAAARSLGPERLIYLGQQPAATVAWLLCQCDIGLCCYHQASTVSMPLKAFDYLLAGLPMVNSLGRELGRLVAQQGVGVQYAAGDAASLAAAVCALADDSSRRAQCGTHARTLAADYDPELQHRHYADFLLRLGLLPPPHAN